MSTKLLVDLPPGTAQRLEKAAEARAATKGGLVRLALDAYLPQLDDEKENHRFVVSLSDDAGNALAAYRRERRYPKRDLIVEDAVLALIEAESREAAPVRRDLQDEEDDRRFTITLSDAAAEMVAAFRDAMDYPRRDVLVERALLAYIQGRLFEEPALRDRVETARGARARTRIRAIDERRDGKGRA